MHSYQSVKSSIDLLLRSASNGLTLNQLNCDYQYYNQSKDIPYANFGYSSLVNLFFVFISFISSFSLLLLVIWMILHELIWIIHLLLFIVFKPNPFERINFHWSKSAKNPVHFLRRISFQIHSFVLLVNKSVKRLALNCLSDTNRQMNISTEHVIRQLTSLTMNPKYSENFSSNEILMISINSNEQCQVVRYTNGKYFIPCFELSRILNLNENILDKETVSNPQAIFIGKTFPRSDV